jgi:uncharacterized protein with von Willebrand factor type A (vWA) domain
MNGPDLPPTGFPRHENPSHPHMSIDLRKQAVVDLSKKAAFVANKHGLEGQRAQVVLVLDISRSMHALYHEGVVQRVIERMLALAMNFDDDGSIEIMLFGTNAYTLPSISVEDFDGYVQRVILPKYDINEATKYAPALRLLQERKDAPGMPTFVIFLTDGNNSDRRDSEALIRELSHRPMFIQFVGIGEEEFRFLRKLDELKDRHVDNAGFMHIDDIATIRDAELFDRLLNEFPAWLTKARALGMVA